MQNHLEKGFAKNILIIIIILVVVFLSQQPSFREYGKGFYSQAMSQGWFLWQGAYSYAEQNMFSKIGGEVERRGEVIKDKVNQEKEKISETIGEKIKNYFSGVIDSIFNSKKNNNASLNPAPVNSPVDGQGQPYP